MVREKCRRCKDKINDPAPYMVMHGRSGYIAYCCSKECYNIVDGEEYDQYCTNCDRGTGSYVCNRCTEHKENKDNNVICAICENDYDEDFNFDNNINKYVCKWCNKGIKQFLLNENIILKYIELTNQ